MPSHISLLQEPRVRYEPDADLLAQATTHDPFVDAAVALSTEFAQIGAEMVATPLDSPPDRDDGILRGLAVRAIKLVDRLVGETIEERGDMQYLVTRLVDEAMVNLGWLLGGDSDRFELFVWDGMEAPRRRRQAIETEIAKRSGLALPIEDRMLRSIDSEVSLAGVDLDNPPAQRRMPGMEERIRVVFPEAVRVYDFSWRLGSAAVHGGWKDLLDRQVTTDGAWEPVLEWREPDAVVLLGTLAFGTAVFARYADHLGLERDFRAEYTDLAQRAGQTDEAYRSFSERVRGM